MDEELCAFVRGESDFPAKADLPVREWSRMASCDRDLTLAAWSNWALRHEWAWEGLRRLYLHLRGTGATVPPFLHEWIDRNVVDVNGPPRNLRGGRPPDIDRDFRVVFAVRALVREGLSQRAACREVADAIPKSFEAVQSIVRKHERATPFRKSA